MCLGVPGRVVAVDGDVATVDFWGVKKQIRLDVVDEPVAPGDYVMNHVGFAIRRIPASDIEATLALYEELLAEPGEAEGSGPEDLMVADVRAELRAGSRSGDA